MIRTQRNAKVHAMATVAALIVAAALQVKLYEWIALTLAIAAVWVAEAFNTALESLADATVPGNHPLIGIAKDCAAGAVLIAALAALVIGLLVFGPKLMLLIRG